MHAIVIFCHVMVSHVNHMPCKFLDYTTQDVSPLSPLVLVGLSIYDFFSMDFFVYVLPPFCISVKISILTALALDYVIALFPLFLSALFYFLIEMHNDAYGCLLLRWMWSPFHEYLYVLEEAGTSKGPLLMPLLPSMSCHS